MRKITRRGFMGMVVGGLAAIGLGKSKTETIDQQQEYNLIDDLVEEMNRYIKEHPTHEFEYFIRCNYSGLGWLDTYGCKRKQNQSDMHEDYKWVYVIRFPSTFGLGESYQEMDIIFDCTEKTDIVLETFEGTRGFHDNMRIVTSRCCAIDYTKRGKKLMELV